MKHLIAVALVTLATAVLAPVALADAPSPVSLTGTSVTNADGSRTLTVSGTYEWEKKCDPKKAKADGYAIAWSDPTAPGNLVANGVAVGTPSDNTIHLTNGCATTGTFGPLSHTYAASVKSAVQVCVVTYHNKDTKKTAGGPTRQTDNSIEENEDNRPMVCMAFTPPPPPPPTDVCPNIEGVQTSIPAGLSKDAAGNCVPPALVPSPPTTTTVTVVKTIVKKVMVKAKPKKCTCKVKAKKKIKVKGVQKKITPRVLPHTR